MPRVPSILGLLLCLALPACGGPTERGAGLAAPLQCVPFARALSGVGLRGDAADWWWLADGRYARGATPDTGSVMVFARTPRLPAGHVAVVSRVVSRREVLVTQANWVHHRVTTDQKVADVSPEGDWSLVRVWWPPSGTLGHTAYPLMGFIYSGRDTSPGQIARAVPDAVRVALGE